MLTGCRAKLVMNPCSIVSRLIASAAGSGGGGKTVAAGRIVVAGRIARGLLDLRRAMTDRQGEDDAVVWGSCCCIVHWVVESRVGEYWRYVGEVGIGAGDVLAYYGSAVWEKGR